MNAAYIAQLEEMANDLENLVTDLSGAQEWDAADALSRAAEAVRQARATLVQEGQQ